MIASLAVLAGTSQAVMGRCTLVYQAETDLKSVYAAGAFNGWNASATPMKAEGRRWSVTLSLPAGRYGYKFVLDGENWILDPTNPHKEDGGNVDFNSLITVYPEGYEASAQKGDGKITANVLLHRQTAAYLTVDEGKLIVSLRVRPGDVRDVELVVNGKPYKMATAGKDDLFEIDRARIPMPKGEIRYGFLLSDSQNGPGRWFGPRGLASGSSGPAFRIEAAKVPSVHVPSWPQHTVLYEIFPDRFANGNPKNDPPGTQPWGSKPDFNRFMGGDAAGVMAHADYLQKLCVGGIYFTPVFESPANHRYLTKDFHRIDPGFGTEQEFQSMTKTLRARGIRSILDGVFSCTGTDFFAFQDLIKNQEKSPYRDWYTVHSYPVSAQGTPTYEAWAGYGGLPLANLKNAGMRDYLLGVAPFWDQRATLGGWRLDSAERLTPEFCRKFRTIEKAQDPEGWIVGEIWGDANQWLQGDMFDSVMGYQFRGAAVAFLAKGTITPTEFLDRLMTTYAGYPPQVSRNLMNLLDSHDTPRFVTSCGGDHDLAILGAAVQLTWPGAPCVYYGDEVGMEGGADPDNRRSMRWDLATPSNKTLRAYRALIRARRESELLQTGEPVPLFADDRAGVVAYARVLGAKRAIVIVNRSTTAFSTKIQASGKFRDVLSETSFTSKSGSIGLTVQGKTALVLLPK